MSKVITTNEKQPVEIGKSGKQSKHISSNKVESKYFPETPDVIAGGTGPIIDTANVDKIKAKKEKHKYFDQHELKTKKKAKSAKRETMTGEKKRR